MIKKLCSVKEDNVNVVNAEISHKLKAHKLGDLTLTITTIVFVVVSLYFNMQFAPFIVLLMSSRIGTSIYTVVKTASKKEFRKLIVWCALFFKSAFSCWQFFTLVV